jgi:hypothetical protein
MRIARLLPEERLVLDAAELPTLSAGLKVRVLSAAHEAQQRRAYSRQIVWAAGFLVAALGVTAWHGPLVVLGGELGGFAATSDASSGPVAFPLIKVSQRYGDGELLLSAAGDDWQLVEAEMHSRRESVRHIRMSF